MPNNRWRRAARLRTPKEQMEHSRRELAKRLGASSSEIASSLSTLAKNVSEQRINIIVDGKSFESKPLSESVTSVDASFEMPGAKGEVSGSVELPSEVANNLFPNRHHVCDENCPPRPNDNRIAWKGINTHKNPLNWGNANEVIRANRERAEDKENTPTSAWSSIKKATKRLLNRRGK